MTFDEATKRYKHTGSRVPDFLLAEHVDHEAKVCASKAYSVNSAAFAHMRSDLIAFRSDSCCSHGLDPPGLIAASKAFWRN